ncbi:hypothetical protein LY78DRAFT_535564, partial [Colletotrichum sublineola]
PKTSMRWLGIYLDRNLSFKGHIEKRAATARASAGHICSLNRIHSGAPPYLMRTAVHSVVIPQALYGSEVWYPG